MENKMNSIVDDIVSNIRIVENYSMSHVVLFKHYYSIIIQETKKLNIDTIVVLRSSLKHDLLQVLLNLDANSKRISFEEFVNSFLDESTKNRHGRLNLWFIYLYTCWEVYKEAPEIKHFSENPYKAVLIAIQRGAKIITHGGYFMVGAFEITKTEKYHNYTLPSLEGKFLNYIDERCGNNIRNTPDQESLNKLWEEFNSGRRDLYKKY